MADSPLDVEAELDRLYALPLGEFVDARNALSAQLKAAGDKPGATRIKALAKPGAPAWAVNQLRFAAPLVHAALLDAGDHLLSGPADVRAAMQARREAIAAARREAESLLERAGLGTAPATLQRVATTLEALATYGRAPGHPVAGRLSEDLPAPGFEELASLGLLPAAIAGPSPAVVPSAPPPVAPAAPAPPPLRAVPPPEPVEVRQARDRAARARDLVAIREREAGEARARLVAAEAEREAASGRRRQLEGELAEAVREEARREEALAAAREARSAAERAVAGVTSDAAAAEVERARLEALHREAGGLS